jgi:hypothetical protein
MSQTSVGTGAVRDAVGRVAEHLESFGELTPGGAARVMVAYDRRGRTGDLAEGVGQLIALVYGAAARPASVDPFDGETIAGRPAVPPSPHLRPDAPSKRLAPAAAAALRLAPLLNGSRKPAELTAALAESAEAGDAGAVAAGAVRALHADRALHRFLADPPPAPAGEVRVRAILDGLVEAGAIGRHVDLDELAGSWAGLGRMPWADAARTAAKWARHPSSSRLWPDPNVAPAVWAGDLPAADPTGPTAEERVAASLDAADEHTGYY